MFSFRSTLRRVLLQISVLADVDSGSYLRYENQKFKQVEKQNKSTINLHVHSNESSKLYLTANVTLLKAAGSKE